MMRETFEAKCPTCGSTLAFFDSREKADEFVRERDRHHSKVFCEARAADEARTRLRNEKRAKAEAKA